MVLQYLQRETYVPAKPNRVAIFDLDGTLADSAPDIGSALNLALRDEGLAPFELNHVMSMVGAGARVLIERAVQARGKVYGPDCIARVEAHFIDHYDENPCRYTKLYPGTDAMLRDLINDGWGLALCTNKPEAIALQVLDGLGIRNRFFAIVGGRGGVALKPARDMLDLVLREYGALVEHAVMIGDSAADFEAARAAGVPVILMSHGYCAVSVHSLGADATLDHFDQLLPVLKGVLKS
jgi:phosphoglycolate phosphatase